MPDAAQQKKSNKKKIIIRVVVVYLILTVILNLLNANGALLDDEVAEKETGSEPAAALPTKKPFPELNTVWQFVSQGNSNGKNMEPLKIEYNADGELIYYSIGFRKIEDTPTFNKWDLFVVDAKQLPSGVDLLKVLANMCHEHPGLEKQARLFRCFNERGHLVFTAQATDGKTAHMIDYAPGTGLQDIIADPYK